MPVDIRQELTNTQVFKSVLLLGTKVINNLSFNRPGEVSCDYVAFEKDQISMCSHGMSLRQKEEDRMLCRLALGMYVCPCRYNL